VDLLQHEVISYKIVTFHFYNFDFTTYTIHSSNEFCDRNYVKQYLTSVSEMLG
jgi:hypothetical protein